MPHNGKHLKYHCLDHANSLLSRTTYKQAVEISACHITYYITLAAEYRDGLVTITTSFLLVVNVFHSFDHKFYILQVANLWNFVSVRLIKGLTNSSNTQYLHVYMSYEVFLRCALFVYYPMQQLFHRCSVVFASPM